MSCAAGALAAAAGVSACGGSDDPTGPTNAGRAVAAGGVVGHGHLVHDQLHYQRGQTQQLAAQATLSNGFFENRSAT